ncbi:hypothetical protein BCR42DRAFT_442934 [Absidia repens]|uniref:Uncharacterized protein n=1 Tax=Absidia repens TaxID=90262 RepID=A0A1X2I238_9FUNG|nr:hypothetical protein BCR42DRAFT_442934 [Absidia repens]
METSAMGEFKDKWEMESDIEDQANESMNQDDDRMEVDEPTKEGQGKELQMYFQGQPLVEGEVLEADQSV